MTVYVDSARIPAQVGAVRGRWSHLTADTPDELHRFAARLGLARAWYQTCKTRCGPVCVHWHYDVTDSKRTAALAAGAVPIDLRGLGAILAARRAQLAAPAPGGTP